MLSQSPGMLPPPDPMANSGAYAIIPNSVGASNAPTTTQSSSIDNNGMYSFTLHESGGGDSGSFVLTETGLAVTKGHETNDGKASV